jgi:uncharacterized protein
VDAVVRDNPDERRYELLLEGTLVGEIVYRQSDSGLTLLHTEVSSSLEGRGLGSVLVAGALDDARARGLRVVAVCPFVRAYVRRHPEYADLVAARVGA